MKRLFFVFLITLGTYANALIINVPSDYSSIQEAINASSNGDTVAVSPGTYYENINFRGKKILLTSLYYIASDTSYIFSTTIDGSSPVYPDTASCVIFNSGEDSTSIIQGFTITGGTGTKWLDIHGAGIYREGGGILIELSSPIVRCNIIRNNFATNSAGVSGAGGGGLRIGDGNPLIENNLIVYNQAGYGPGIVLNYTGCVIRNNIIASNTGGQLFSGGSGLWILENLGNTPKIIVNNTIINNSSTFSSGTGGILVWSAANVIIKNNIIAGNYPTLQIKTISSTPIVTYNNIEGGFPGTGNINENPQFTPDCFILDDFSACIDAGDSSAQYNDNAIANTAIFPSKGTERNDMGAFGGPHAKICGCVETIVGLIDLLGNKSIKVFPNPAPDQFTITGYQIPSRLNIYDIYGKLIHNKVLINDIELIELKNVSKGNYILRILEMDYVSNKKIIIE